MSKIDKNMIPYYWDNTRRGDHYERHMSVDPNTSQMLVPYAKFLGKTVASMPILGGMGFSTSLLFFVLMNMFNQQQNPIFWLIIGIGAIALIYSIFHSYPKKLRYHDVAKKFVQCEMHYRSTFPRRIINLKIKNIRLDLDSAMSPTLKPGNDKKIIKNDEKIAEYYKQIEGAQHYHEFLFNELIAAIRDLENDGNRVHIDPKCHNIVLYTGQDWYRDPDAKDPMVVAGEQELQALEEQLRDFKKKFHEQHAA